MPAKNYAAERHRLVEHQLKKQGIRDPRVLNAINLIPREEFISDESKKFAYRNAPLPIGEGQTISQPYIVALMAEALELNETDRVLEIGTGSGYAAAILASLAREVYTVERYESLVSSAQGCLNRLGIHNVRIMHGDGTLGWSEHAPYDAIVVAASGPHIPEAFLDQLKVGGQLVIPVGQGRHSQKLMRVTRTSETDYHQEDFGGVRFVPLIGQAGWQDDIEN